MTWKDRKPALSGISGPGTDRGDEDMASRRVLNGLGVGPSKISFAEESAFGGNFKEESMWSRTVRLWQAANKIQVFKQLKLVTKTSQMAGEPDTTILAYRDGNACYALFCIKPDDVLEWCVKPPFAAIGTDEATGNWLLKMELSEFARQSVSE
jgi:hypothetical protein